MRFLNHNLFTGDITVNGTTTLSTATGVTRATGDNSTHLATTAFVKAQGYATTAALAGYVPTSRTLTINGTTYDLSANRSWTISTADGYISNVQVVGSTLSFTGVGSAFSGIVDLSTLTPTVRTVYETVKNVSGATILKGTPLAVVAGQTSGNVSDVVPADAADPTKMPAVFIANQNIADEAEGEAVLFGNLTGVDTSLYQSGTTVYVAPGGGWTATKPVWPNLIQNLGVITKQHPTNGAGIVTGVGRANSLPNLTAGKIWVGSATYPIESTTVHVDEANARVGIGTTSPSTNLHVAGSVRVNGDYTNRLDLDSGVKITGQYYGNGGSELTYLNMYNGSNASINIGTKHPLSYISFESGNGAYTERMRITNTGNIGIGTTAPTSPLHISSATNKTITLDYTGGSGSYSWASFRQSSTEQFRIWGSYSDGYLSFYNDQVSAHQFTLASSGNVGIGTTNPFSKLTVSGALTSSASQISIVNTEGGHAIIRSGIAGVSNNGISFITASVDGTSQVNNMVIDAAGEVGIGTTQPMGPLEVYKANTGGLGGHIILNNNGFAVGNETAILFNDSGVGSTSFVRAAISSTVEGSPYAGDIKFKTGISAYASLSTQMIIKGNGNVGIGTSSPSNKLQVANGDMSITTGYSFILADTDTNWRLGRNIISPVESVYLNSNTFEFVAANGSDQGWQFINDDGYPVLEIGAATGSRNVWVNAGNLLVPTGSVGIGTTAPQQKLDVYGNISLGSWTKPGSTYVGLRRNDDGSFGGGGDSGLVIESYNHAAPYTGDYSQRVHLRSHLYNGGSHNVLTAYGINVGIGIDTPSEKLHVVGRARITTIDNGTGDFATISGTGVITRRTAAQVLSDIGAQPSGSYLTAESDTLSTVVARGSTTSSSISVIETTGGGFLFRTNSGWGAWARNGFSFANGAGSVMKALGAYGDVGTSVGYMYLGTDYLTNNLRVYDNRVYIPGLDLAISNSNGSHGAGTYFRGDGTHFVLGLNDGNTLYLNYGNPGGTIYSYGTNYHSGTTVINGTASYTTGGAATLSVVGNVISFGASNGDLSYFRRLGAGQFQWQTYNSGNTGEIHLQPYGGNVGVSTTAPTEKLHVVGRVRIDGGSTAAILETNDATASDAGTTYKTFTTADHYAVTVDYVIYDAGRTNMRTGTFRAVWSTGDVVYTDVSTVDLGATDNVTLTAVISGANVNLIVTGPTDYTLKYNLKVIK